MYKILYAASNTQNSKLQLSRFMEAIQFKPYIVKVAAYKDHCPNIHVDWTLDSLSSPLNRHEVYLFNNYSYDLYLEQIKYYNPDLIITDLEIYTSHVALDLNIPLWQYSPSIIKYAFSSRQKDVGIHKKYRGFFYKNPTHHRRLINIVFNSDKRLICSHFGDLLSPPEIIQEFEWSRPYHQVGKDSVTCQHNIVAASLYNHKNFINQIKNQLDVVMFSDQYQENYQNITLKNLDNQQEYYCNLKNCNTFVCEGQTTLLADAFYNSKKAFIITDHTDADCLINTSVSDKMKVDHKYLDQPSFIQSNYNSNIKFLDQSIDEFFAKTDI